MSWRIETANNLALMQELPDAWAQTCLLRPPRELPSACLVAVLEDAYRVVRDDGTLWLALPGRGAAHQLIEQLAMLGWQRPVTSQRVAGALARCGPVSLFTKRSEFFFEARLALSPGVRRPAHPCPLASKAGARLGVRRTPRRGCCVPGRGELSPRAIEWCILASSSPYACAICGTAWEKSAPGGERPCRLRAACGHSNDRGRSLVLEPFCGLGEIGRIAVGLGRSYLGIEQDPRLAEAARRRLHAGCPELAR